MFNVQITPNLLNGKVSAPPSKSVAHRLLICAALASRITSYNVCYTKLLRNWRGF